MSFVGDVDTKHVNEDEECHSIVEEGRDVGTQLTSFYSELNAVYLSSRSCL